MKVNIKKALCSYFGILIIFGLYLFFWRQKNINLTYYLDSLFGFSLRKISINFVNRNYSSNLKSFLNLILFNNKKDDTENLYKLFINISSVHLLVISGSHFSLLLLIIRKIFFFNKTTRNIVSILLAFFICYFNNFSLSVFRCFIYLILDLFFKYKIKNKLDLSLIIILIIVPLGLTNYGMQMSYICLLVIDFFNKVKVRSKFLKTLLISFFINLFLIPYNSIFNGNISILSIFYSNIMSPIIMFFYVLYSFIFWIKELSILTENIFNLFMYFYNILKEINVQLHLIKVNNVIWFFYLLKLWLLLFFYRRKKLLNEKK